MPKQAKQKTLDLYVVYENPSDFPGCFVVRKWRGNVPEREPLSVGSSIDEARSALPEGLHRMNRLEQDDPVIREVWL